MIGAILGGSSAARLGFALRSAEIASMCGFRVVVVSGVPEVFPIGGKLPILLAPGYEGTRDVDILAECCAAQPGLDRAAKFFSDAALYAEGANINKSSNDLYWSESMRTGLESYFQAACYLAALEGRVRSLSRIVCECADDLRARLFENKKNGSQDAPSWMSELPRSVSFSLRSLYTGTDSQTADNHHTNVAPVISAVRAPAPQEWTVPFAASSEGDHLFIHTPSWGNAPFYTLLSLCLNAGDYFLFPEAHSWTTSEQRRVAYFLHCERQRVHAVWTSASVPAQFVFGNDWEAYGRSEDSGVLRCFENRVMKDDLQSAARLKELKYETPASLDNDRLLLGSASGWSVSHCAFLDRKSVRTLKPVRREDSGADYFGRNMEEAAAFALEERRRNLEEEIEMYEVRIVEGVPQPAGRDGLHNAYALEGETILLSFDLPAKKNHFALVGGETGKPREPLALYECVWKADTLAGRALRRPLLDAFLPLRLDPGSALEPENDEIELYSPLFGQFIRLVVQGEQKISYHPSLVAFGTWITPRKRFLVRSLLKLLLPSPKIITGGDSRVVSPRTGLMTSASFNELRNFSLALLSEFEKEGDLSVARRGRKQFAAIRMLQDEYSSKTMDRYFRDGEMLGRIRKGGFLAADLTHLRVEERPSDVCSAVDVGWLPRSDYRKNELSKKFGTEFVHAFDRAFAGMMANLDWPEEE